MEECEYCGGRGSILYNPGPDESEAPCEHCLGRGEVEIENYEEHENDNEDEK